MAPSLLTGKQMFQLSQGITGIGVSGYKSVCDLTSIEIRPLTLLAGANSSGKSSMMQLLLMLKQTLEAPYDPGPLLLDGPNVRFTSADQFISCVKRDGRPALFSTSVTVGYSDLLMMFFAWQPKKGIEIRSMSVGSKGVVDTFAIGMSGAELTAAVAQRYSNLMASAKAMPTTFDVTRDRCFLDLSVQLRDLPAFGVGLSGAFPKLIREIIHLPGLRGNPLRSYPVSAVGDAFPGQFQDYAASVISQWQLNNDDRLILLGKSLQRLGLTWKVQATRINDTQVELQVGRLSRSARGGAADVVNVADVGLGVSQTLPVLVALLAARPGQLVYLEQPELHLHPRAQSVLAEVLADAAKRGVRVVAETHSSLLLLGIQSLVAEGQLAPELVKLHWFQRRQDGSTEVKSADLDQAGAFGEWPEDFGDVSMETQARYLTAAEKHLGMN